MLPSKSCRKSMETVKKWRGKGRKRNERERKQRKRGRKREKREKRRKKGHFFVIFGFFGYC